MKKLGILLSFFLLIASWLPGLATRGNVLPLADIELLQVALAAAGAQPQTGELHVWAYLSEDCCSLTEAEDSASAIARALGLNRHRYDITSRSTGSTGWACIETSLPQQAVLHLVVSFGPEGTIAEASIRSCEHNQLTGCWADLERGFLAGGARAEAISVTSSLEGCLTGKLNSSEKLDIAYRAFSSVQAAYRGATEARGASQWCGWSPHFAGVADSGEHQANFCLSLHWDADRAQTVIMASTPVLP